MKTSLFLGEELLSLLFALELPDELDLPITQLHEPAPGIDLVVAGLENLIPGQADGFSQVFAAGFLVFVVPLLPLEELVDILLFMLHLPQAQLRLRNPIFCRFRFFLQRSQLLFELFNRGFRL